MVGRQLLIAVAAGFAILAAGAIVTASARIGPLTGRLIAFSGCNGDSKDVYVIHADGTGLRRLTETGLINEHPAWSPDGAWLVFDSYQSFTGTHSLSLLRFRGSSTRTLVSVPAPGGNAYPAWSPGGRLIAFSVNSAVVSGAFSPGGIYLVDRDGKNLRKIAGTSKDDHSPAWSPDGTTLAFDHGQGGIELIRLSGKGRRQLTDKDGDYSPAWSPDGRQIAFSRRDEHDNDNIWVMNADGSGQHQLTGANAKSVAGPAGGFQPGHAIEPAWSPNGRQIAFAVFPSPTGQLYVMDADGSHPHSVRRGLQMCGDLYPNWQP
jgi:TolB protein